MTERLTTCTLRTPTRDFGTMLFSSVLADRLVVLSVDRQAGRRPAAELSCTHEVINCGTSPPLASQLSDSPTRSSAWSPTGGDHPGGAAGGCGSALVFAAQGVYNRVRLRTVFYQSIFHGALCPVPVVTVSPPGFATLTHVNIRDNTCPPARMQTSLVGDEVNLDLSRGDLAVDSGARSWSSTGLLFGEWTRLPRRALRPSYAGSGLWPWGWARSDCCVRPGSRRW